MSLCVTTLQDCSDEAFLCRHGSCEAREKKRFLNFVSGGQRKRPRPNSMSDFPADGPCEGKLHRPLLSPSSTDGHEVTSPVLLLAWLPRKFPLGDEDMDALAHPVPPPPLSTPPSTPSIESPLLSPTEWTVLGVSQAVQPGPVAIETNHSHIVLKLSKKS